MPKEDTIKKVKLLGGIVSQEKFASAMADLADAEKSDTARFDAVSKDAKVFLTSQGVTLPAEATAQITKNSPVGVKVCLNGHCVSISISTF